MNLRKIIREEIYRVLAEGGNIPGVNSTVPKQHLYSTVKNGLKLGGFPKMKFTIVGNKNKPYLGDVDVAVESKDVAHAIGYKGSDKDEFWFELGDYLKKQKNIKGYKIVKGLTQFHLVVPLVDNDKNQQSAVDKNGVQIPELGYTQIDVFIGDLKWMVDALSASDETSKYKAVYRNLFLVDMLSQLSFKTKDPDIRRKLQINWKEGIEIVEYTTDEKGKRKKLKIKKVTGDMNKFSKFLFGGQATFKDIDSFEKIYKLFKSKKFKFPKIRKNIIDAYKKTLKNFKLELPKELK